MNTNTIPSASETLMLPLNLLVASAHNVRKTGGMNVDDLAASIQAVGLLQNLTVLPKGKKYEVIAGGRRLRALQLLQKQKAIANTYEVRCDVRAIEDATEISTAENVVREAMHAADQFDSFKAMVDAGRSIEDVAARFGVSTLVVRQRMKLATLAPSLIALYREDKINLDQLVALSISDDHAAQERVWLAASKAHWLREPRELRAALTQGGVRVTNPLVRYVTLASYEKAGGVVSRDLFGSDKDAFIVDTDLLNQLASEKLERKAAKLRAEGWKWVEVRGGLSYNDRTAFRELRSTSRAPDANESLELEQIDAELEDLFQSEDEDAGERIDALEARQSTIRAGLVIPTDTPEARALSGVVVYVDGNGNAEKVTGLFLPADYKTFIGETEAAEGGDSVVKGGTTEDAPKGISEALQRRLTAHRTVAVRALLADNAQVALVATVHALALPIFYARFRGNRDGGDSVLTLSAPDQSRLTGVCADIEASPAWIALSTKHQAIAEQLPAAASDFWDWLLGSSTEALLDILAIAIAPSVDLVMGGNAGQNSQGRPLACGDAMVKTLGLDMADFWTPTASSYLASVPKDLISEAVTEALGPEAAQPLAKMKKGDAVSAGEALLAGTRWVPSCIR